MQTKPIKCGLTMLLSAFLLVLLAGCRSTPVQNQRAYEAKFTASAEQIHLSVALRLPEKPVSSWFSNEDCARVARAVFTDVTIQTATNAPPGQGAQAILTPKLFRSDGVETGSPSWCEQILSLSLVWTLTGLDGEIIWADTVKAQARGYNGYSFNRDRNYRRRVKELADAVAQKSYQIMVSAAAIKDFADSMAK